MNFKEIPLDVNARNSIYSAEDKDYCRAFVNAAFKFRIA